MISPSFLYLSLKVVSLKNAKKKLAFYSFNWKLMIRTSHFLHGYLEFYWGLYMSYIFVRATINHMMFFQGSCNSSLSSNLCPVVNNKCQCAENNSSACDSLDQQAFVDITGATNESASQWTCCLCSLNSSFCCNKCIIPTPATRGENSFSCWL